MLVSVIIATYNYEKYVGETLQSLIAQTHRDWECIVVDDGSRDNTKQIVAEIIKSDNRIKYLYQENAGQASARNKALRVASGKYVQFLDADDLLEPRKLESHVDFLESNPDVDIVYGEARYFRNEFPNERRFSLKEPDLAWMPKISGKGNDITKRLIEHNIFTVSSPLTRKTVVDKVGDFDITLSPVEDWDFWMRCAVANASIKYYESENARDLIRIHAQSSTQNLRNFEYKHLLMRRKFDKILPDDSLRLAHSTLLMKGERCWVGDENIASLNEIKRGQLVKGFGRMLKAFRFNPTMFYKIAVHRAGKLINGKLADEK